MISIRSVQEKLASEGCYLGQLDGSWGPLTQRGMTQFMRKIGVQAPPWLMVAERELGVAEIHGDHDNPRIIEYHAHTSLAASHDEIAWCSSFANYCVDLSGLTGTNSAAARSWLHWGEKTTRVRYGCIAVFARGNSTSLGHVAFVVHDDGDSIAHLGGNQSNKVCVQVSPKSKLLDLRWPSVGQMAQLIARSS
jgi:uncharacterized protein (TIGR02594 family)